MNSNKKSIYNIVYSVLGQAITIAMGLVLPRLFLLNYGSEVNGFLTSVNSLIAYLSILEAGVGAATIQALYVPIAKDDKDEINSILAATQKFYNKTGLFYLAGVMLLSVFYPMVVRSELSYGLQAATILIIGLSGVISYFMQAKFKLMLTAEGKQYIVANIATLSHMAVSVTKIILVSVGVSVLYLQVAHFFITCIQVAIYYLYIGKKYRWINLKVTPNDQALSQKGSVLIHELAQMVFNRTDVLLLTLFTDLKVVSIYSLYNMLVDMVSTLIQNINTGFVFRMAHLYASDKNAHNKYYDIYETFYIAVSFALYCITYMFLKPFVKLYTHGIEDANYMLPMLPVLFIGYKLLVCGRACCGGMMSYAGHFKQTRHHSIIEAALNLGSSILLIVLLQKLWGVGIYGALLGTIIGLVYRANVMILYANRVLLKRSSLCTYRKWIINFLLLIIVYIIFNSVCADMCSYIQIIANAAIWGCSALTVFVVVNCMIDKNARWFVVDSYHRMRKKRSVSSL